MPFTCRVYPEHELAILTFTGDADGKDFIIALRDLVADPDWKTGYDRIWDETAIQGLVVEYPDVQEYGQLAESLKEQIGGGRSIIVARGETHVILSRLYKAILPWPVEVASSVEEAFQMLGKQPIQNRRTG